MDSLLGHNKLGASWEGIALEQAISILTVKTPYFWKTHTGVELDLLWHQNPKRWAIETKYADAPRMTLSLHSVLKDLRLHHIWIIYPGNQKYRIDERASVVPLEQISSIVSEV